MPLMCRCRIVRGTRQIPRERRDAALALLARYGVRATFAGHYHRNAHGWADGGMEMVTTSAVGKQLGDDRSGLRVVRVQQSQLLHEYVALE